MHVPNDPDRDRPPPMPPAPAPTAPPPMPRELRDRPCPAPAPVPRDLRDFVVGAPPPMPRDLVFEAPPPLSAEVRDPAARSELPPDLRNQLLELEEWAAANKKDARTDAVAFWSLKVPAILAAASAGVWAHFELTAVSVITGAVASLCVIIDGIHPRGMLRNTHLRAYHDLRILTTRMITEWRSRNGTARAENVARKIIRDAEEERQRIAAYIRDAETALNPNLNR